MLTRYLYCYRFLSHTEEKSCLIQREYFEIITLKDTQCNNLGCFFFGSQTQEVVRFFYFYITKLTSTFLFLTKIDPPVVEW